MAVLSCVWEIGTYIYVVPRRARKNYIGPAWMLLDRESADLNGICRQTWFLQVLHSS